MLLSRRRLPLLLAFPAIYVGIEAARTGDSRPFAWLLVSIAVVVAVLGGRMPVGEADKKLGGVGLGVGLPFSDQLSSGRVRLLTAAGLSITIASAALATRPGWAAIARSIGAWLAMMSALRSIGAIDGDVGLASKASEATVPIAGVGPRAIVRGGMAILTVSWLVAVVFDAITWVRIGGASPTGSDDDGALSSAPIVAAVMGTLAIFALGLTALLIGGARRLELVVPPRALACAGGAGVGLIAGVTLTLSGVAAADASAALGGTIAAAIIVRAARARDPIALARSGRRALTLMLFGGPVAALAAIAVEGRMPGAGGAALVLAGVALIVGALSPKLEEPFLPVKGILIDALSDAREAAREREARTAMAHALMRIREACASGMGPSAAPSPELWLLHPTRVLTVNAAGYLQERDADLPEGIFEIALGEPYGTLRTSVLRALEVRRADLRPLLAWLQHRDALFATVIAESDDPDGLLVIPTGARTEELTLEEARGAKLLADAFVAVSQATSAKVRHLDRERELKARIDALDDETERLRHTIDLDVGRHALAAARLARPATVGVYSAAARMAYEALERRILQDAPVVIVAASGVDPVPYIARAHLAGPRKNGPLVVVDATSSREHDLDRWLDAKTSPLALADHGLLVLVDGTALPRDIQTVIARAAAERRPPWERASALDFGLVLSSTKSLELPSAGLGPGPKPAGLGLELAARFEGVEEIRLPRLRERSEDLRSIVADRLAREGLRVTGRPVGIDAGAFGRLVEYPFDGEDAELAAIVTRVVANAAAGGSDVVRAEHVDALALHYESDEQRAEEERERAQRRWRDKRSTAGTGTGSTDD